MNLDQALNTFFEESRELLAQMEDLLLAAEGGALPAEDLHALFRCAHTIKGSAGLFGLEAVVGFTHGVESVLDRLRNGEIAFEAKLGALLLECRDHIGTLIEASGGGAAPAGSAALGERLAAWLEPAVGRPAIAAEAVSTEPAPANDGAPPGASEHWHLSLRFAPNVLADGMDPLAFIRYLGNYGEIVNLETLPEALPEWEDYDPEACYLGFEIRLRSAASQAEIEGVFDFVRDDASIRILPPRSRIEDCAALLPDTGRGDAAVLDPALARPKRGEARKVRESASVRVPLERLDELIGQVGELVIAGATAREHARQTGHPGLAEAAHALLRLVEDIRDTTFKLRMVPIGEVFSRFPRVVRDVARELGKEIDLKIRGAETELDKSMVEKIGDPLTHLVRNAIDHGIEPAERRRAVGKLALGEVRLNAYHDSGSIVIEVADDGGGLDCGKILKKAQERGLVSPEQALSRQEIFRLILEPGFSTAEQVTNISGRGVGMDVVRSSIEALRGTLDIDSEPGRGTTMRICLPLTLAIIEGFLVTLGNGAYILPLDMVAECIELPAGLQADYLDLRGEVLPLIRLGELFEVDGLPVARPRVVVVRFGQYKAGLVVDMLLGQQQTVIKPLSRLFERVRGISGYTLLGSGDVALILDVPRLLRYATERGASAACMR